MEISLFFNSTLKVWCETKLPKLPLYLCFLQERLRNTDLLQNCSWGHLDTVFGWESTLQATCPIAPLSLLHKHHLCLFDNKVVLSCIFNTFPILFLGYVPSQNQVQQWRKRALSLVFIMTRSLDFHSF